MLGRMMRWAREGSIAVVTVVTLAGAPATAHAGWFSDVKDAVTGLGMLMSPTHDLGKFMTGSVMVGGGMAVIAGADIATFAGAAALGTAITFGGIAIVAVGAGLAIWGGYKLWKSFHDDEARTPPTPPDRTRPGEGTTTGPGRIDPGGTHPGNTPGTVGGGTSSTPGENGPRTRPRDHLPRVPTTTQPTNVSGAAPAGWMRP